MNRTQTKLRGQAPPTAVVKGVGLEPGAPATIAARFRRLVDSGVRLAPAGAAQRDPRALLRGYLPRYAVRLFDATYYLTDQRFNEALGFFVGYVALGERPRALYPRIFYKDSSLVWRVASHFVHDHREYWIGKGDVRWERHGGEELLCSVEETTNLPYEVQAAFDAASRQKRRRRDDDAIELVLREGPSSRIRPYADFVAPRRRAAERWKVHGGRSVARLRRRADPESLTFAPGFEPDFERGVIERTLAASRFFGGELAKYRILSRNGRIQYYFLASPAHVWVGPPQTLTTELSTYGVRVDDVIADELLFIPAFEYHDEASDDSQIPAGYAGAPHPDDPHRSDATAWIEALPIVRDFRAKVLRRRRKRG